MSDVVWQRAVECVGTQIEDSLVLLDLEAGMYFALNGPAADIWEIIAEPNTERSLVDALVGKYRVEPAACAASVSKVLQDLARKGLAKSAA